MATPSARVVPNVVSQHAEMAAHLFGVRTEHTHAPHVKLKHLLRVDNRLAADLDGLKVSGDVGAAMCLRALDKPEAGVVFAAAVGAIDRQDEDGLARLQAVTTLPDVRRGLIAAFGWLERGALQGVVARWLSSAEPLVRLVGVAACALHRVDPGLASPQWMMDASPLVRARALRTAGEIGCIDVVSACEAAVSHEDPGIQFWSAWSAVLLGNRNLALQAVTETAQKPGPHRSRAFCLSLLAMTNDAAHGLLKGLAADPEQPRWLIQGAGMAGDPTYVPWLFRHMEKEDTARLAGEAFSLITGVDLALLDLERRPPDDFESGPNDEPDDPNVEMDDDDGLPWPDAARIEEWWAKNGSRFTQGTRYFMGAPVTSQHCINVLKTGYQRQRLLAAHYLCLLDPGTPLFNTSAPAWRQQRLLAEM